MATNNSEFFSITYLSYIMYSNVRLKMTWMNVTLCMYLPFTNIMYETVIMNDL